MNDFFMNSLYAGVVLSLLAYLCGSWLQKKTKIAVLNPLLVSIILTIVFLKAGGISYAAYNASAKYLSWLLTPATICLAIPLYEKWELLKKNRKAVLLGLCAGVVTSLFTVFILSCLFGLTHEQYVTLLPKSITTAIGMGVSQELGGIASITVIVIIMTGVLGNMFGEAMLKALHITEPISRGLALGASSHAIGTAKAIELGEIEGAMSGLAIAVCGLLTVILAPFAARLL